MKDIFIKYVENNIKEIILIITIMFIGLIIGVLCINNVSKENEENIKTYVNSMIDEVKKVNNYNELNKIDILNSNLKRNIIYV